ncbi:MAG TPA: hypothetical protein VL359_02845 [bacterium]|nr:hypothetical protein [bacterium]
MGFSSYQIGRLIAQMRKAGLLEMPAPPQAPGVDRVQLSSRAQGALPGTLHVEPEAPAEAGAPPAPAVPEPTAAPEVSPTQVMRLIEELRAARLLEPGAPAAPAAPTGQGIGRAPLRVLPLRPGGPTVQLEAAAPLAEVPVAAVREAATPPAPVQAELERRAGSFMQPPLPPEPAPPPIPKVKREKITLPSPKPHGEGD